jgi:predicted secreted protein
MTTRGGFGLTIKIMITATLTAIVDLLEGEIPEFEKYLAEATPHNAPGGYAKHVATGKFKMNEFKFTLGWDKADTTHAAVLAAFNSTNTVAMQIVSPSGNETISFDAHVFKLGRVAEQEESYTCEVSVQPSGQPTLA